ncbi:MAG: hypothetical protein RL033_2429 [Pseudomonadota bacterium]
MSGRGKQREQLRAGIAGLALLAASGCRKPPPAELVYTGSAPALPGAPTAAVPGAGAPTAPLPSVPTPGGNGEAPGAAPSLAGTAGSGAQPAAAPPMVNEAAQCTPPAAPSGPFSKAQLIAASADCATWHYCTFESSARALESATRAYRDEPSAARQGAAQQAFGSAMASWQRAELFRFGPAARSGEPGGQDLRDLIYAWPVRAECKVDEQTVSQSYGTPEFHGADFAASPVTGRTLSALEYLLFNPSTQNRCSAFASINAGGGWAALTATEVQERRRAYAAEAAADVTARSGQLLSAWSEGFRSRFTESGAGNPSFTSEQQVLNAVSNALFYLDLEMKDQKLATPLGLTPECTATACPDAVESRFTANSLSYLRENLIGFRRLFQGCGADYAGVGFDDWLRDAGAGELAERILSDLGGIETALARVQGSLAQVLLQDRASVLAVHTAVKTVTDELKTEFVTVLNLELPSATEGDND